MIIAIDGTSGSGKSTIAKSISERTGFELLNTGMIYRRITKECLENSIRPENEDAIFHLLNDLVFDDKYDQNLHTEEISKNVPLFARIDKVREKVRVIQRQYAKGKNIIVEGRDIGSIVFPEAEIKLFIDADINIRTRRRILQLGLSEEYDYEEVLNNLKKRDSHDINRSNSPLVKANDAIQIDTGNKTLQEALNDINDIIMK